MAIESEKEDTAGRIADLATSVKGRLKESIAAIEDINSDIHVLSINAKIQAARAGSAGAGFGVVADEVRKLVTRTRGITAELEIQVANTINELMEMNTTLKTRVRGERLSQLANTAIDIVDRNLYERSCDVRWWATEDAVVRALSTRDAGDISQASQRLGVILDSYTVYLDIVVCDLDGRVVANGRPEKYHSSGTSVKDRQWFSQAKGSRNGTEFGFEGVHNCELVNGQWALVYSCGIRRGGNVNDELIGVLGIVFNWVNLGNVVVERTERTLASETSQKVRVYLCYPGGVVIATTREEEFLSNLELAKLSAIWEQKNGFMESEKGRGREALVGFAHSKGFETYSTGWYAIAIEDRS